jgi:hypothetical protein
MFALLLVLASYNTDNDRLPEVSLESLSSVRPAMVRDTVNLKAPKPVYFDGFNKLSPKSERVAEDTRKYAPIPFRDIH